MIVVVADTRPLIALERIGHLAMLKELFEEVPTLRPLIDSLLRAGFRADPDLVERVLRGAGEA